jgi:undecaprenyl-diphosphatase
MRNPLTTTADQLALRHVVRETPDWFGRPVDAIGDAATGGRLWLGAAAALGALGPRGRRAAVNGAGAYLAASALSNGPAKWASRRARPKGFLLADLPRLGRRPSTSSFPSAHTAAAVAFATAASIELPPAAPVLLAPAAAVALARIRAVRHYPTDVLAGAALGGAVGVGTAFAVRRWRHRGGAAPVPDVSERPGGVEVQAMDQESGMDASALGS